MVPYILLTGPLFFDSAFPTPAEWSLTFWSCICQPVQVGPAC